MAKIPYITGEVNLDSAQNAGWERYSKSSALGDLSSGLGCHEKTDFKRSDISVPTPWALLVSFDIFLGKNTEKNSGESGDKDADDNRNDFGDLEKNTVNEWRGLLTLIALKRYYDVENELDRKVITINTEKAVDDSMSAADKKFFDTLFELHPQKSLFGTGDEFWDEFSIIKLKGETIGVYSPLTLVCSLYTYESSFALQKLKEIGIVDDYNRFINPVEFLKENMALSLYMSGWLEKLLQCLNKVSDENNEVKNRIVDYIDDLGNSYKENTDDEIDRNMYEPLTKKLFVFESEFSEKTAENAFDILQSIKLEKMNLKIPELLNQIKIPTASTPIFMLEYLGHDVKRLMEIFECEKDEGEYWDKSFVFHDRLSLVEIKDGNFFSDVKGELVCEIPFEEDGKKELRKYMCVLPINDAVLEMIPAKVIGEDIRCTQTEESVRFSLSFNLDSGNSYVLEQEYSKAECNLIAASQVPTVAIWPYARFAYEDDETGNNAWKDYYVYTSQLKRNEEERETYALDVKCDMEDTQLSYQDLTRANGRDSILRRVAQYDKLPTYLSLAVRRSTNINRTQKNEEKLGIIILPEQPMINQKLSKNVEYMVGLDFGTTATTAFCKKINDAADAGKIKFIQFGNTKGENVGDGRPCGKTTYPDVKISEPHIGDEKEGCFIAYNNPNIEMVEIDKSFVGKKYPAHRAYSSIFKLNTDVNVEENKESLKYGNVIYDQSILGTLADGSNTGIMNNLKWGGNSTQSEFDSKKALSGFLNQIMKTVALTLCKERVGKIEWRFSYPTALSEDKNEVYRKITTEISGDIEMACGVKSQVDDSSYYPESVASAKYLGTKSSGQYISIDIGGGSTDVSLWSKNTSRANAFENIMQFSIGIASRKIFLAGMTDAIINPQLLFEKKEDIDYKLQEQFDTLLKNSTSQAGGMEEKFKTVKEKITHLNHIGDAREIVEEFSYTVEMLLQLNSKELEKCFEAFDRTKDQKEKMERFLIMGLWGILYYTAKSISCLGFVEKLSKRERIYVNFAGNGSKMYDWLGTGQKKRIKEAFEDVLGNDLQTEFIYREDDLKTEAASGMLLLDDNAESGDISEKNDGLVDLGEYKVEFDNEREPYSSKTDGKLVPPEYRRYFETNDIRNRPKEVYPLDQKKDLGEYIDKLATIVDDVKIKEELLKKIECIEFTENIKKVLEDNFNKGTIAPFFIIEIEALLRTCLGY